MQTAGQNVSKWVGANVSAAASVALQVREKSLQFWSASSSLSQRPNDHEKLSRGLFIASYPSVIDECRVGFSTSEIRHSKTEGNTHLFLRGEHYTYSGILRQNTLHCLALARSLSYTTNLKWSERPMLS